MRIKVFVVDSDTDYTTRLVNGFHRFLPDKVSLKVFSDIDSCYEELNVSSVNLLLVDRMQEFDVDRIPDNIACGLLCEQKDIEEIGGINTICKYQKIDTIYKMMLGIYAEKTTDIKFKTKTTNESIVMFTSVQGGSGVSTVAAAYALRKASHGKKVFYLNLQKFGDSDFFFEDEGNSSFSDVLYTLKSKRSNLIIKLESALKKDTSGVEYFSTCKNAYDMFELKDDEIITLVQALAQVKEYDEIIIDLSGTLDERMCLVMKQIADKIIYVSDGSPSGNIKFDRFCQVVKVLEQRDSEVILSKTSLLYNRFSSKTGEQLTEIPLNLVGGIRVFKGASGRRLIEAIAQTDDLDKI